MHDSHLLAAGEVQGGCPSLQGTRDPCSLARWTARATGNRDSRRASVCAGEIARDSQSCRRSGKNCVRDSSRAGRARHRLGQCLREPIDGLDRGWTGGTQPPVVCDPDGVVHDLAQSPRQRTARPGASPRTA